MKLRTAFTALATMLVVTAEAQTQDWIKRVYAQALPAVVEIVVYDAAGEPAGLGAGFVVREDGIIVTNKHVMEHAVSAKVIFHNGESYEVQEYIPVQKRDIAIVKIAASHLRVVPLANSDWVEVGDPVVAIGHPAGLEFTLTWGIVSQIRGDQDERWIQTQTPISPGNSGGVLLNESGQVIGMMTLSVVDNQSHLQNLNFAMAANHIRNALRCADLLVGGSRATVSRLQ